MPWDPPRLLREKLSEIDPMAFAEIVKSGEAIEDAKNGGDEGEFPEIRHDLTARMTPHEIATLYGSLKEITRDVDCSLFEQGQLNSHLFFIGRGEVKLVYHRGEKTYLLKKLSTGDIAGTDTFFDYSVCTSSLITLSRVKLGILDQQTLDRWREAYPSLASKLRAFCLARETPGELIEKQGIDRRIHGRRACTGPVWVQLLSGRNTHLGNPFRGQLADISVGGASFHVKTSKPGNTRLLLGRAMELRFAAGFTTWDRPLSRKGTATAVKKQGANDYCLHVCFAAPLEPGAVGEIADHFAHRSGGLR